jgi:hypothetical protein
MRKRQAGVGQFGRTGKITWPGAYSSGLTEHFFFKVAEADFDFGRGPACCK